MQQHRDTWYSLNQTILVSFLQMKIAHYKVKEEKRKMGRAVNGENTHHQS